MASKRKARIASTAKKLSQLGKYIKGDAVRGNVIKYGSYPIWQINKSTMFRSGYFVRNDGIGNIAEDARIRILLKQSKLYSSRATLLECLELCIRQDELVRRLSVYLNKKGSL